MCEWRALNEVSDITRWRFFAALVIAVQRPVASLILDFFSAPKGQARGPATEDMGQKGFDGTVENGGNFPFLQIDHGD